MAPICIEHSIEMGSNTNILDIEFQEQDRCTSHLRFLLSEEFDGSHFFECTYIYNEVILTPLAYPPSLLLMRLSVA